LDRVQAGNIPKLGLSLLLFTSLIITPTQLQPSHAFAQSTGSTTTNQSEQEQRQEEG
jgi:hypothetical protein